MKTSLYVCPVKISIPFGEIHTNLSEIINIANRCYGVWLSKEPKKSFSFGACFDTPNATALLFFKL